MPRTKDKQTDPVSVPNPSVEAMGHAGVKFIREITDYQFRQDFNQTIHTIKFGEGSSFSVTYSSRGEVVAADPKGVRFERRGESLFVMKDTN